MNKPQQGKTEGISDADHGLTLGKYGYKVIDQQYHHVIKQEKSVLADKDPERLHQMRVGGRRLYTALQVFEGAVKLPKPAQAQSVRKLTKVLGQLRDLDVQVAAIQEDYQPQVCKAEQKYLKETLAALRQQRKKALAGVQEILTQPRYTDLKAAYETWLSCPEYTPLAEVAIATVLPDLLSPLLSVLLLHPGWLIPLKDISDHNIETLHDLRKACKHVRYQADFFIPFYGDPFKQWIAGLKQLQDNLGKLQDIQVLRDLLADTLPKHADMKDLNQAIQQKQAAALADWEDVRQQYLDPSHRYQLHRMILDPQIGLI